MKAIFYKEWIKTKWYLLLAFLVTFGFAGYAMLRINRIADIKGMGHLWEVMLERDAIFVDSLEYIPLVAGILLALVQFVPELQRKCLKLTLHLPSSQLTMINMMIIYGIAAITLCFGLSFLMMFVYLQSIMPVELYSRILLTALPWYIAGISAYILVAWICLEPTWKFRVINSIIAALMLKVFFIGTAPEAYNSFLPWMILYALGTISFSWLSIARFKEGKQD